MQGIFESIRSVEARFLSETVVRLVLAAILGGIIGLERELKRKPAGLRTNLLICFGSALFTIVSAGMAVHPEDDHTRIAAQIVTGVGFIGAGSILHARGSVTGLTTAATIWVVASIGMASGAGLYLAAVFATVLILGALSVLGVLETRLSLKASLMAYEAVGVDAETLVAELNSILEASEKSMEAVQLSRVDHEMRAQFRVYVTRAEHESLLSRLRSSAVFTRVSALGESEKE